MTVNNIIEWMTEIQMNRFGALRKPNKWRPSSHLSSEHTKNEAGNKAFGGHTGILTVHRRKL